jgi:(2R)-ethylmalonyl-CoA mutase
MEVVYEGIRLTPAQIANAALEEGVHVIGLSILSGSHVALVRDVMERLTKLGLRDVPVVVGGIIPPADEAQLIGFGVARVYTPKNYDVTAIMADIVELVERQTPKAA